MEKLKKSQMLANQAKESQKKLKPYYFCYFDT